MKKSDNKIAFKGLSYVIVRTYSAGVFAGYLKTKKDSEVTLYKARRFWQWKGANTLSDLATNGTTKPQECKFPVTVESIVLLGVIEIIDVTNKAQKSIESVPVWSN